VLYAELATDARFMNETRVDGPHEQAPTAGRFGARAVAFDGRHPRVTRYNAGVDPLLEAILADPDDDEVRRVYADRLCELGDPRGEMIHLQLAGFSEDARERARELVARHATEWLGPLVPVVSDYEFARGFLAAATVPRHRRPYNVERVVGHPIWTTVERFDGPSEIYLHPVMRSLRDVTADGGPGLRELCCGEVRRPIRRLRCRLVRLDELDAIGRSEALPELADLEVPLEDVRGYAYSEGITILDTIARVLAAPVMTRLRRLALEPGWRPPRVAEMIAELERRPTAPVVTTRDPWGFRWTLARDAGESRYRRIGVAVALLDPLYCSRLVEQLGTLATECRVEVAFGTVDPTLLPHVVAAGQRLAELRVGRR
jgi:uncharacterized protein (TIGR02996 family)